jgi:CHAT domain-containing protein/tetratricopeptide (TPR) repeat protein
MPMTLGRQFTGIAGICCLMPAILYCQQMSTPGLEPGVPSAYSTPMDREPSEIRNGQSSQEALRRKAEELAQEALVLSQKQTSGGFRAGTKRFKKSAQLFLAAGLPQRAAEINLELGDIYYILSTYPEALDHYSTGLLLAVTDETRCRILARMARTYSMTGQKSEAVKSSGQAVSLSKNLSSRKAQGEAYEARGEALYASGDLTQAAEQFQRALELFDNDDAEERALALIMLAEVTFEEGNKENGIARVNEALRLWLGLNNSYGVAKAQAVLGTFSMTAGKFETARCYCEAAKDEFEVVGDDERKARALNTLGYTSMQIGEPEVALKNWLQTRAAYARMQDRLGEAATISIIGKALIALHRFEELPGLFQEELRLAKQVGHKSAEASALADIAGVEELNKQYSSAESHYLESLDIYHSLGSKSNESEILTLLGELFIGQGEYRQARSFLEQAYSIIKDYKEVEDEAKIHYDLAYIHRKLDHLEDAISSIEQAIPIIERQRSAITKFDSRASYFAAVHNYYKLYIELLMLHHHPHSPDKFAVQAFEASERGNGRSLLDWLLESDRGTPCPAVLHGQASLPAPESQPPSVTLQQAQMLIRGDDAILLEYSLGDEKSYVWAVTEKEFMSYELPSAKELKYLVQSLREAVTARQKKNSREGISERAKRVAKADEDFSRLSRRLSQLLLGPVPLRGKKRIIFVPKEFLNYVPFAALPIRDIHGGQSVLAEKYDVIVLPSASVLAAIRKTTGTRPRPPLPAAVFADPVFQRDDPRVDPSATPANQAKTTSCAKRILNEIEPGAEYLFDLRGTHEQAEAAQRYLGKKVYVAEGFQATLKKLHSLDLTAYRLLQFATHGLMSEKHPELSAVILSLVTKNGAPQDGCLGLAEVNGLKLAADLVVLSSCDSARGKELSSEGIIGLPRSFLRAGARSVIATLWKVDSAATTELMVEFYRHLGRGESPALALRNSQLYIRNDPRWSKEYFWAAFVLQGDYRISSLN